VRALGPPCPRCGHLGRRSDHQRQDKKYHCVNHSCDVLFYSWQDSVDAVAARVKNEPPPEIESKKQIQENLFDGRTKRSA
jgi:hypothetical protein